MVSFAQATANPGLIQARGTLEIYDKQGNCKSLDSPKDIIGHGNLEEVNGESNNQEKEYYEKMIEFIAQAGPHHFFMYVNNNNIDLPLISPVLPHFNLKCPIEKYIWNF